jgi:hypothetical protein
MPERPLLLFPTPQPADRTKGDRQFPRVHIPNVTRQSQRLSPMFNQLQAAFKARKVEIQQNTAGIGPEQVLVIETIGSVENFANAIKRIEFKRLTQDWIKLSLQVAVARRKLAKRST